MASAWGNSWGVYWGNSWGTIASTEEFVSGSGDDGPGKKKSADNRRAIYKPTGLPPTRNRDVERRVAETEQIQAEVRSELQQKLETLAEQPKALNDTIPEMSLVSLADMSPAEIDFEIGVLLAKKFRTDEEDALLMILAVVAT